MSSVVDFIDRWLHEGTCRNDTGRELKICVDGGPGRLAPGEETPPSVDCDGVIHDDDSATKIYGRSGIKEHKSAEWVREHWPRCAAADAAMEGRRDRRREPQRSVCTVDPTDLSLRAPSAHDLVAARRPLVALSVDAFLQLIKPLETSSSIQELVAPAEDGSELRVFVSVDFLKKLDGSLKRGHTLGTKLGNG